MLDWLRRKAPTRDDLLRSRILRPFARHLASPNLWRFNRTSVPRGVAVGLFFGVMVPVAHMPVAVLASSPFRANAIVAAAVTWVINPITIGPMLIGAHWIGTHIVGESHPLANPSWWHKGAAMAGTTAVGLLPIAIVASALGYAIAHAGWRLRAGRRWARRNRA